MYGNRNPPTEPPCDTCRVELQEENVDAARIFQTARGQVRTLGEQVIDLDFNAVKVVMDLFSVKNQRDVFEKVRNCFYHFLNEKRGE